MTPSSLAVARWLTAWRYDAQDSWAPATPARTRLCRAEQASVVPSSPRVVETDNESEFQAASRRTNEQGPGSAAADPGPHDGTCSVGDAVPRSAGSRLGVIPRHAGSTLCPIPVACQAALNIAEAAALGFAAGLAPQPVRGRVVVIGVGLVVVGLLRMRNAPVPVLDRRIVVLSDRLASQATDDCADSCTNHGSDRPRSRADCGSSRRRGGHSDSCPTDSGPDADTHRVCARRLGNRVAVGGVRRIRCFQFVHVSLQVVSPDARAGYPRYVRDIAGEAVLSACSG